MRTHYAWLPVESPATCAMMEVAAFHARFKWAVGVGEQRSEGFIFPYTAICMGIMVTSPPTKTYVCLSCAAANTKSALDGVRPYHCMVALLWYVEIYCGVKESLDGDIPEER